MTCGDNELQCTCVHNRKWLTDYKVSKYTRSIFNEKAAINDEKSPDFN